MSALYIGLMSGTSLDGIDAALVEFKEENIQLIEFEYFPFSKSIIKDIQSLSQPNSAISLKKYGSIDAPKSTGKEYFSPAWLNNKLSTYIECKPEDIQASLCQLTAETITEAIMLYAPLTDHTLICGGGMHNSYLINSIRQRLTHPVSSTAEFGVNPDYVEAMAFAWLARQTINNLPGNLTEVTGAKKPVTLGAIYHGSK
ncbi:MAG: anhydro-N-acetylmuramic acid kinase [Methylococcales bacterium]|nr:anhydro-N-acetylmuramic acid kinase [Methylococcales bacterium]